MSHTNHYLRRSRKTKFKKNPITKSFKCFDYFIRAWIGIHDTGNDEGTFRCIADEKKIAFKSWHRGEPNNWGKGEDCTEIYFSNWGPSRQWNDIACSHSKPFVCELAQDTPEEGTCPDGTTEKAGKCYKFVNKNHNFHNAEKECKRDGGHLACPQSREENEAIHALAKRRYGILLSLFHCSVTLKTCNK